MAQIRTVFYNRFRMLASYYFYLATFRAQFRFFYTNNERSYLFTISNHIVSRVSLGLKIVGAGAKFGDGYFVQDCDHGVAHFLHDATNRALLDTGAGAGLVKILAGAMNWCQGSLDVSDDLRERDHLRRAGQAVAARYATSAFDESTGFQVIQNLFKEAAWNVLLRRDRLNLDHTVPIVFSQYQHGAQSIPTSKRKFHNKNIVSNASGLNKISINAAIISSSTGILAYATGMLR